MKALFGHPVFSLDAAIYRWEDVVAAAEGQPRWKALLLRTRQGLACLRHLEENDEEEPEDAIAAAAADFRYQRDLISGDDAQEWLSRRGVTIGEWMDYIRRTVLRELWESRLAGLVKRFAASGDELDEALRVDAICSDEAIQLARELAERVAAATAAGESLESGTTAERLALIENGFQRFKAGCITGEAVRREIAHRHLDWIRVDCRAVGFEDPAVAREAALCVREDGLSFDEVARDAHTSVYEERFYLDELDAQYRTAFIGAKTYELLGPIEFEGKHTLFRVLDKVMPSAKDPELIRRAGEQLLKRELTEEVEKRVKWELGW